MNLDVQLLAWWPLAALTAAVVVAARWWHRRRVAGLMAQLARLDRARQQADQLTQQARRQIEQLQKELTAQRQARAELATRRRATPSPATTARAPDADKAAREALERALEGAAAPQLPAHGFADTQPMH